MICEFCEGQTLSKKVRKIHWFQRQLYLIEGVEAQVCQECGERYYHATILDAIDNSLRLGTSIIKEKIQVQVVDFQPSLA
jgi:YgiT-type zinc finger domain-containing protein